MKKKIQNEHIYGMFKSSLFVFFLFFGFSASAQSYPDLLEKAEAQVKILQVLSDKDADTANYPVGSQEEANASRSFLMYVHSLEFMQGGMSVEEALTQTFLDFALDANNNSIDSDQFMALEQEEFTFKTKDIVFDELVNFLSE